MRLNGTIAFEMFSIPLAKLAIIYWPLQIIVNVIVPGGGWYKLKIIAAVSNTLWGIQVHGWEFRKGILKKN